MVKLKLLNYDPKEFIETIIVYLKKYRVKSVFVCLIDSSNKKYTSKTIKHQEFNNLRKLICEYSGIGEGKSFIITAPEIKTKFGTHYAESKQQNFKKIFSKFK